MTAQTDQRGDPYTAVRESVLAKAAEVAPVESSKKARRRTNAQSLERLKKQKQLIPTNSLDPVILTTMNNVYDRYGVCTDIGNVINDIIISREQKREIEQRTFLHIEMSLITIEKQKKKIEEQQQRLNRLHGIQNIVPAQIF